MQNDDKVLAFMFDPFLLESLENETEARITDKNDALTEQQIQAKKLEFQGVELANSQDYDGALKMFDDALALWPERASLFNNRAQTLRLLNRIEEAKQNLDVAIDLCEAEKMKNGEISNEQVARQAYCQRAQIFMLWNKQQLGIEDIKRAAELGSGWAKTYLAKSNPYSALCNQMLHQMFQQCGAAVEGDRKQ